MVWGIELEMTFYSTPLFSLSYEFYFSYGFY